MTADLDDLDLVRDRLAAYRPSAAVHPSSSVWAATALVVTPGGEGLEVVFIQRPDRPGDRWSGQMALPGGKRDAGDRDAVATAQREAQEEVGLHLPDPVGRLDDVRGRAWSGLVATFTFVLEERPDLHPHPGEVAAAVRVPLRTLLSVEAAFRYAWGGFGRFPAIRFGEHVIWGLTHQILGSFAEALGVRLPPPR